MLRNRLTSRELSLMSFGVFFAVATVIYAYTMKLPREPGATQKLSVSLPLTSVQSRNRAPQPGFDLTNPIIPLNEVKSGGPPKDGIPAITNPKFLSAEEARFLKATDRVVGVVSGKESRAYPVKILDQHEIVNDRLGETPLAITYCPLCDSVATFDRRTDLGEREFGVSGLLYNSNVLMYDRGGEAESLWSQLGAQGVTGSGSKKPLKSVPFELTTWESWKKRYPDTQVMSADTGHRRNYERSPYQRYFASPDLMFPVKPLSRVLPAKQRVLGLWTNNAARAYPLSAFGKKSQRLEEQIDGREVVLEFDAESQSVRVVQADEGVQWIYSFWFAWYAFRPETEVFKAQR